MNYLTLSVLTVVMLSGCAVNGPGSSPPGEAASVDNTSWDNSGPRNRIARRLAAEKAAHQCTGNAVRELDDLVSPADVIGRRVADACYTEWMVYNKYVRPAGRRTAYMVGWYHRKSNEHRAFATQAVLRSRSDRAALPLDVSNKPVTVLRTAIDDS